MYTSMFPARFLVVFLSALSACAVLAAPFAWIKDPEAGRVVLLEGDQPVLRYNYGDQLPPGVDPRYTRSCYVHPIHGLDGEVLTDDFPPDHYHHRGLSWMWPSVRIGDDTRSYDLWHIRGIRQHFDQWIERSANPYQAILAAQHRWKIGDQTVALETMRLVIHRADDLGRAIDVELRIVAGDQPLHLHGAADKGYGAFCLRYASRQETLLTTIFGPLREDSLEQWYEWTDLSARFAKRELFSGIAVFSHPHSADYGSSWILRHYGFVGTSWPGLDTITIPAGESFMLRHRLYLHRGNATDGGVAQAFERYRASVPPAENPIPHAAPPKAR